MTSRIPSRLESVSNVAVIVACIAFVVVLAHREWPSPQPGSAASLQGATIHLASLAGVPTKRSFVMFISETCHFCEQEMPFYRTLRERLPSDTSLIAVFPSKQQAPARFLAEHFVKVDHVVSSDALMKFGVTATPTLLLVDGSGKVMRAWVGAQSDSQHNAIVATVARDM